MSDGTTDDLKGRVKEAAGDLTDDDDLYAEKLVREAVGLLGKDAERVLRLPQRVAAPRHGAHHHALRAGRLRGPALDEGVENAAADAGRQHVLEAAGARVLRLPVNARGQVNLTAFAVFALRAVGGAPRRAAAASRTASRWCLTTRTTPSRFMLVNPIISSKNPSIPSAGLNSTRTRAGCASTFQALWKVPAGTVSDSPAP